MKNLQDYKNIPVETARKIAERFEKSQVVILAFDAKHEVTQTTTYGVTAFDKENAAATGEKVTAAIGYDLSKRQDFEDFHRDYNPALFKEMLDLIQKLFSRHDGSPCAVGQMERILKAVGRAPRRG